MPKIMSHVFEVEVDGPQVVKFVTYADLHTARTATIRIQMQNLMLCDAMVRAMKAHGERLNYSVHALVGVDALLKNSSRARTYKKMEGLQNAHPRFREHA